MTGVRIGLIGAGIMGSAHAASLASRVPHAELVAVSDVRPGSAEALAGRYGVEGVYRDHTVLLAEGPVDAVVIATPGDTHGAIIEAAAVAGAHVFCEKPLERGLVAADRAIAAIAKAGLILQVGFHRRFDPHFVTAIDAVRGGSLGQLMQLRIVSRDPPSPPGTTRRPSGDIFFDTTIHDFDMARVMAGEVESVFTLGSNVAAKPADDPDTATMLLRHTNGVVTVIENTRVSPVGYDQRLEVLGSEGVASVDNQPAEAPGPGEAFFIPRYRDAYAAELRAFVDCIRNRTAVPVTGDDGRRALVLALAAHRSYLEGRPVLVSEIG